jgi:hypothetical protein
MPGLADSFVGREKRVLRYFLFARTAERDGL